MNRPAVSIIVPFRNRAALLPRTLQSIAVQTYTDYELLLVDNASTDNSASVCSEWCAAHSAIHSRLLSCPTPGASAARNTALRQAQGEFVYFFDSDDEISPSFLSDAAPFLPSSDLILSATAMVFPDGTTRPRRFYRGGSLRDHLLCSMLSTQSLLIRRSLLESVGGWDETLPKWNDWELAIRLMLAAERPDVKVSWLNGVYHRIYQHADSLTGKGWADTADRILPALDKANALLAHRPREQRAVAARRTMIAAKLLRKGRFAEGARWLRTACRTDWHQALFFPYALLIDRGGWRVFRTLFP